MKRRTFPLGKFLKVQAVVAVAFAASYAVMNAESNDHFQRKLAGKATTPIVKVRRDKPLWIKPLYNDPEVVSDQELAAVLKQVRPRFAKKRLKPNHVEHALRTWRIDATFQDPKVMSGEQMRDFLIDHGQFLASWDAETEPLLRDSPDGVGVGIRWGRLTAGSVHHDHWLACLTEAGIPLSEQVFTPTRRDMTINDVVQQALYDFRLDEVETEWTAMAFGLWLPPTKSWKGGDGRELSFDMLAKRLLRGHKQVGVCGGTHRVYSLMLFIRLDDEFDILSDPVHDEVYNHLKKVRDLISQSQFDDGHWPYNWPDGKQAIDEPANQPKYRDVIATGHHLEWLAIAPKDLHPPRKMILKAAAWIIKNTTEKSQKQILKDYTFYSHVGNALALWRGTRAADFWRKWQKTHPYQSDAPAKPSDE